MKRIFIIFAVCLVLLTGCDNSKAYSNLPRNVSATQDIAENEQIVAEENILLPVEEYNESIQASIENDSAQVSADFDLYNITTNHNEPFEAPTGDVIEIKEKLFIAQTNDIYFNPEDYLGKTIKYEGIFDVYEVPDTDLKYYFVIRYGPGCCGVDSNAGFEVKWDQEYPAHNDWVEVTGVLEEYEDDGFKYLRLDIISLSVLPVRGEEYVWQ